MTCKALYHWQFIAIRGLSQGCVKTLLGALDRCVSGCPVLVAFLKQVPTLWNFRSSTSGLRLRHALGMWIVLGKDRIFFHNPFWPVEPRRVSRGGGRCFPPSSAGAAVARPRDPLQAAWQSGPGKPARPSSASSRGPGGRARSSQHYSAPRVSLGSGLWHEPPGLAASAPSEPCRRRARAGRSRAPGPSPDASRAPAL